MYTGLISSLPLRAGYIPSKHPNAPFGNKFLGSR